MVCSTLATAITLAAAQTFNITRNNYVNPPPNCVEPSDDETALQVYGIPGCLYEQTSASTSTTAPKITPYCTLKIPPSRRTTITENGSTITAIASLLDSGEGLSTTTALIPSTSSGSSFVTVTIPLKTGQPTPIAAWSSGHGSKAPDSTSRLDSTAVPDSGVGSSPTSSNNDNA